VVNIMEESYKYFSNKKCEYYPCHPNADDDNFNCLFCYCPLYRMDDCGGSYCYLDNGIKDCSMCKLPHEDYDYIIKRLMERN